MSSSQTEANMFQDINDDEFIAKLKQDANSAVCLLPRSITRVHHQTIAQLAGGFNLQVDIYYRNRKPAQLRPALVFMHDWAGGQQPQMVGDRQCNFLALQEDIFCVSLYYRQPQDGKYPAALEDLKCCLRWLRSIAADYAIDPDKIAVMGSSAGSQWTWLAAASNDSKKFDTSGGYLNRSSKVNLIIIRSGMCDLVQDFGHHPNAILIMGGSVDEIPDRFQEASPLHQIRAGMPPVLMIHGELDKACPLQSAEAIASRLRELKVAVELVVYKGRGHGLNKFGGDLYGNMEIICRFIRRNFAAAATHV